MSELVVKMHSRAIFVPKRNEIERDNFVARSTRASDIRTVGLCEEV